MRGAREDNTPKLVEHRIIPADAGSTYTNLYTGSQIQGSSPRMRGALVLDWESVDNRGIIPADAGSTSTACRCPWLVRDHPRGCGEHYESIAPPTYRTRIIPADAGSTSGRPPSRAHYQDHPRGCGEHRREVRMPLADLGSSPRMRGAHVVRQAAGVFCRIIPADAGSTRPRRCLCGLMRDHPRGCGEHISPVCRSLRQGGSSPRMRGARSCRCPMIAHGRIIPADAGSTYFEL